MHYVFQGGSRDGSVLGKWPYNNYPLFTAHDFNSFCFSSNCTFKFEIYNIFEKIACGNTRCLAWGTIWEKKNKIFLKWANSFSTLHREMKSKSWINAG